MLDPARSEWYLSVSEGNYRRDSCVFLDIVCGRWERRGGPPGVTWEAMGPFRPLVKLRISLSTMKDFTLWSHILTYIEAEDPKKPDLKPDLNKSFPL